MKSLIGRTIVGVEYIDVEAPWDEKQTEALVLDDGTKVYALSDEEGNDVGCLMLLMEGDKEFYVIVEEET